MRASLTYVSVSNFRPVLWMLSALPSIPGQAMNMLDISARMCSIISAVTMTASTQVFQSWSAQLSTKRWINSTINQLTCFTSTGDISRDVKHDFETWRRKLSSRAIVLFHDTQVRDRGFGVYQLWETAKRDFPHFEFTHCYGLGVLGVGHEPDGGGVTHLPSA